MIPNKRKKYNFHTIFILIIRWITGICVMQERESFNKVFSLNKMLESLLETKKWHKFKRINLFLDSFQFTKIVSKEKKHTWKELKRGRKETDDEHSDEWMNRSERWKREKRQNEVNKLFLFVSNSNLFKLFFYPFNRRLRKKKIAHLSTREEMIKDGEEDENKRWRWWWGWREKMEQGWEFRRWKWWLLNRIKQRKWFDGKLMSFQHLMRRLTLREPIK